MAHSVVYRYVLSLSCAFVFAATLCGQEQLLDGGLEASTPNGTFPDSGFWFPAVAGPEAGAICVAAGRTGGNAFWIFTGNDGAQWWSAPFQEVSAYTGAVLTASAWVRTPPSEPWVAGSRAYIQVDFLDLSVNVLASYQSRMLTVPNTTWAPLQVSTGPAPAGTTRARFICYLSKPSGNTGVSVVNFDDCSLLNPQQNLVNSGFEQTHGGPPFPTNWDSAHLGEAGAVAVRPSDQVDKVLWQYTGTATSDWFSVIHQAAAISPGDAFRAGGSIRTPPQEPWANGSQAYFRVQFLNASNMVVGSYQSGIFTTPNTSWSHYELVTEPAPASSARAIFSTYLLKPPGAIGQSIVNFDDCYLASISIAGAQISSRVLGVRASQTQTSFQLRNTGKAPLTWQIVESIPWMTPSVTSGTVAPLTTETITMTVNRTGIAGTEAVKGTFTLNTSVRNYSMDIFMDMPGLAIPSLPSEVRLQGRQMRVRDRLQNGSLSDPYAYIIKGSAWSPASIGTIRSIPSRREEFLKWYVADIQLHRAMNANTVYVFMDFGTGADASEVLDNLYKNGIKAIVTVDENGTGNSNRLQQIVTAYRNHPAILAWAIGNEWNINFFHGTYGNIVDSANATESMARQVKALDPNHPVATTFGDIDIPNLNPLRKADENPNQPISTERIVNDICPSVDIWGLNIYRGGSFGTLFGQWASISSKPMFLSEFGTDAFNTSTTRFLELFDGVEDEATQAAFNRGLWMEIVSQLSALRTSGVCLGGAVFEWNDEWWKVPVEFGGSPDVHENLGYFGGQPDGYANEEWFALTTIDRRLRQSYFNFQADFAAVNSVLRLSAISVEGSPGAQTVRLQWIGGTTATQYLEARPSLAGAGPWTVLFTNRPPTSVTNEYSDTTQTNRFYRIRAER